MFEDGIYVHQTTLVLVIEGIGMEYSMNWYGDLGDWEIWKKANTEISTEYFDTVEEMFAGVCGYHWTPEVDSVEFFPADELPFELDDFPPASEAYPETDTAIYDGDNTPLMAWAMHNDIIR